MTTPHELLARVSEDAVLSQFISFLLDGSCPTKIPKHQDENTIALELIRSVATDDRSSAQGVLQSLAKRRPQKSSPWLSNDLLFVAIAVSSVRFNAEKDFVRSVAEVRDQISAGGAHQGLAQAVMALASGGPDFTVGAGIFSLSLSRYVQGFVPSERDVLAAYDSYCSYDPDRDFQTPVTLALAIRGYREILAVLESVADRGQLRELCSFAQSFPSRLTRVSRVAAWTLTALLTAVFIGALLNAKPGQTRWGTVHTVLTSGLGISSLWAVLSLIPAVQKHITRAILWAFGYPKATLSPNARA